jgi:hypothetical protein
VQNGPFFSDPIRWILPNLTDIHTNNSKQYLVTSNSPCSSFLIYRYCYKNFILRFKEKKDDFTFDIDILISREKYKSFSHLNMPWLYPPSYAYSSANTYKINAIHTCKTYLYIHVPGADPGIEGEGGTFPKLSESWYKNVGSTAWPYIYVAKIMVVVVVSSCKITLQTTKLWCSRWLQCWGLIRCECQVITVINPWRMWDSYGSHLLPN